MDKPVNFKQVIEVLEKEGYPEEKIAQIVENLAKIASAKFYGEAMTIFSDEDLIEIEKIASDEEANQVIAQKFEQKTGRDPEIAMQFFLNTFAQGFLEDFKKDKQSLSLRDKQNLNA